VEEKTRITGTKMEIFTYVLTVLALVGVVLNIKKNKACFYIWSFTNSAWAIVDFNKGIPAQGILFSIYAVLAIYGLWEWRDQNGKAAIQS
jgi:membrane protein implicated in regulation of membrane protease activity